MLLSYSLFYSLWHTLSALSCKANMITPTALGAKSNCAVVKYLFNEREGMHTKSSSSVTYARLCLVLQTETKRVSVCVWGAGLILHTSSLIVCVPHMTCHLVLKTEASQTRVSRLSRLTSPRQTSPGSLTDIRSTPQWHDSDSSVKHLFLSAMQLSVK